MELAAPPRKKRARAASTAPKVYAKGPIPYQVSAANRYWRIKKDLPADQYWKKRYWRRRITGKGDYVMNPRKSFGQRWGGYAGSRVGEFLGGAASRLLGLGDYKVKRNVLAGRLPEVTNVSSGGGTVIRFQEYLGDVITSATAGQFLINTYLINAANPNTFPFLSQIAANYEQYEFEGLVFEFRSTSADALNSINTALGSVMMATQYDTFDTPFASKTEMLNYEYSTSAKPSCNTLHMVECEPRQTAQPLYYTLFNSAVPTGADPRLYHLGVFTIGTTGFQGTSVNIGELHVTYQVRLLKPKLYMALGDEIRTYNAVTPIQTGAYNNTNPLGLVPLQGPFAGSLPVNTAGIIVNQTNMTITFPATNALLYWRVEMIWQAANAVAVALPAITTTTNLTLVSPLNLAGATTVVQCGYLLGYSQTGNGLPAVLTLGTLGTLPSGATQQFLIRIFNANPATAGL
uniref:Capsid protein n=1 Tax=Cruciviridae sp. TaxID=1955495 RepID=A0A1S6LVK0_9VIRU|nr:capsid protein [Cruciviridae sp.]